MANYRKICFKYHIHKCVCCGEKRAVTVHHNDGDRNNHHPVNLIPLCPNCHWFIHSKRYSYLVAGKIKEYVNKWIERHKYLMKHYNPTKD